MAFCLACSKKLKTFQLCQQAGRQACAQDEYAGISFTGVCPLVTLLATLLVAPCLLASVLLKMNYNSVIVKAFMHK